MARTRRQNLPSVRRLANNIPNPRTLGSVRLRAFIRDMETPKSFREALGLHLGIAPTRTRLQPIQPEVITRKVGNVAQRRKDLVRYGKDSWQNGLPHGAWSVEPHDSSSPMIVATLSSSTIISGVVPSVLYRFVHRVDSLNSQDHGTYLDVITHGNFFNYFFSRFHCSIGTSTMTTPRSRRHLVHLPVVEIGISDLHAMYHILQWIYLQDSSLFLRDLLGEVLSASAGRIMEYDYRKQSRAHPPERFYATLVETTLRIVSDLPRTTEADDTLHLRLRRIDAVFQLADELGLEDETFWKILAVARRLVFDLCAISHQLALRSQVLGSGDLPGSLHDPPN